MVRLLITGTTHCKHQDENHPMSNLKARNGVGKWLVDSKEFFMSLVGVLKLENPSVLERIQIGNAGSSSIAILVSNHLHKKWSVLLKEQHLRTEDDLRKKRNMSSETTFSAGDFTGEISRLPWRYVQILCYNKFRKRLSEQFGLSFIHLYGEPIDSNSTQTSIHNSLMKLSPRSFVNKPHLANGSISSWEKIKLASQAKSPPTSPVESKASNIEDDVFDTCVKSFLESGPFNDKEVLLRWEELNGRPCSMVEKERFLSILKDYNNNSKPWGILTPHDNNRLAPPLGKASCGSRQSTLSLMKPHLYDNVNANAFGRDKSPLVFRSESMTNPIKENGVSYPTKEDVDQSSKENQNPYMRPGKCLTQDSGKKKDKIWTGGRSDDEEEDDVSPSHSAKRKYGMDRSWLSRKRLRDARTDPTTSPSRNGRLLSPPQRPDSPPVVDDINSPSTSKTETIAERNIRLEIERRLAQRTIQDRVMRAPSGKVKGPYCTKGVTVSTSPSDADSPLSRLSISEDTDDETRQARRKLHFPNSKIVTSLLECPFCSGLYESTDIEQHVSECSPSPRKLQPPEDDEDSDMIACPICMTFVSRDTVATHADQCALKRYGA